MVKRLGVIETYLYGHLYLSLRELIYRLFNYLGIHKKYNVPMYRVNPLSHISKQFLFIF